jgi:ABC-type transport system involved in multi-copper enzyme maturation permease subunit
MVKLLSLEYLKFKSYKPFWIILGLYILCYFAVGLYTKKFIDFIVKENANDFAYLADYGLPLFDFVDIWQNLAAVTFLFKYILAFVVIISICLEFSNKTIKQNLIDGLSKPEFLFSKLILVAFLSVMGGILLLILGLVLGLLYSPVKSLDFIILNLEFVPAYVFEVFSLLSLAVFFAFVVRRTGFAIILFIFYALCIEPIGTAVMEYQYKLAVWYFPVKSINNIIHFPFQRYLFREIQDYVAIKDLLVALFWTSMFILGSWGILKRRDV